MSKAIIKGIVVQLEEIHKNSFRDIRTLNLGIINKSLHIAYLHKITRKCVSDAIKTVIFLEIVMIINKVKYH